MALEDSQDWQTVWEQAETFALPAGQVRRWQPSLIVCPLYFEQTDVLAVRVVMDGKPDSWMNAGKVEQWLRVGIGGDTEAKGESQRLSFDAWQLCEFTLDNDAIAASYRLKFFINPWINNCTISVAEYIGE